MRSTSTQIKRVYEEPDEREVVASWLTAYGLAVLAKLRAKVDVWLRDIAPSTELRKWFSHDPVKWDEFQRGYLEEGRAS